jgi:hypothetical protein
VAILAGVLVEGVEVAVGRLILFRWGKVISLLLVGWY